MVVDTSVLAAILLGESEGAAFLRRLSSTSETRISAATYVEICIVTIRRLGPDALETMQQIIDGSGIQIEPLTESQARAASEAFVHYGKGRHPAALNFGDCFSYALATELGEPLFYKGNDFDKTDVLRLDART